MLLGLWALLAPAQAADVLVVEATPATLSDFSVAFMVYDMIVTAARDEGLDLDDADAVRAWAGKDADACFDNDACPANLWDRTDARLAIVMSVGQSSGGLDITVRLHNVDDATPLKVIRETVRGGGEEAFAKRIALAAKDALPLLPMRKPVDGPVLVLEDQIVPGADLPPLDEPDEPALPSEPTHPARPDPEPPPREPTRTHRDEDHTASRMRAEEEQHRLGVPAAAFDRYQQSGLDAKEWRSKARVRAGRVILELGGGWSLGDVDRGYGVRLKIAEADPVFDTLATSSWEGAGASAAPGFGFGIGYAPAWFLDTSVFVGVQYGKKHLNTGWECALCDPQTYESSTTEPFEPVSAVQGVIEPRLRLYPVATGYVKPYALVGFTLLLHDGFQVPDLDFVDFPDTPAGASFGPTGGVGVAIDAGARFSIYAEVPATLLVSPGDSVVNDGAVTLEPERLDSAGYILRFTGGIAVRI